MSYLDKDSRRQIGEEVFELGEALFDSLIDAAAIASDNRSEDSCSAEDWRETADVFLAALRLLLDQESEADE